MASLIGTEIGKYRITERIGRGGMAEVYEGIHTHLDRKVAVKVLHSHLLEGGDFVARFKREAKAVANLRHHLAQRAGGQGSLCRHPGQCCHAAAINRGNDHGQETYIPRPERAAAPE